MDLATLDSVKLQIGIADTRDDAWLATAITAVSAIMETACRRWLAPRGTLTRLFDGILVGTAPATGSTSASFGPMWIRQGGRSLQVPDGLSSLAYLGVAESDQPDDGTGTYQQISRGVHLRGAFRDGWPHTRIELDGTAPRLLPSTGYSVIKATGSWGPAAVYPRIAELAAIAVTRAYRARSEGSGSADIAVVGPDGGMRILRRIAPAEMAELLADYAPDTRPAFASVGIG